MSNKKGAMKDECIVFEQKSRRNASPARFLKRGGIYLKFWRFRSSSLTIDSDAGDGESLQKYKEKEKKGLMFNVFGCHCETELEERNNLILEVWKIKLKKRKGDS